MKCIMQTIIQFNHVTCIFMQTMDVFFITFWSREPHFNRFSIWQERALSCPFSLLERARQAQSSNRCMMSFKVKKDLTLL